jgi:hypothetical protein
MKTFLFKLKQTLTSKTFWTVVILAVVNAVAPLRNEIPAQYLPVIDSILALFATLFHIFPSKDYSATE